ncbi:MAG: trigger factor [Bacteroidales bacterium]|nr:trigger factor [Bacteroidales bacterium]
MNITREDNGALHAYLKLELVPQDYEGKVAEELKNYRKKVNMNGFRPGQVPAGLVKQMYGKAILMDVINRSVAEGIDKYIKDEKVNILGHALPVDDDTHKSEMDFDKPAGFTFWFEIGLVPEFKVELEKIKVRGYEITVSDEMVDKHMDGICRRYGKIESPETVGDTDTLGGELTELNEAGEAKENGISVKTSIAVDMIALKTIQKQFIGKKKEDKVDFEIQKAFKNKTDLASMLNITEDRLAEIAPKFRFTIHSITRVEPAALGEDLYEKAYPGIGIKDEKAFREHMRNEISGYYSQNTDKKLFVDTVDTIVKDTKFDLNEEFVKRWVLSEQNREAEENKKETVNDIPEEDMKQILRSLRWELIQNRITEQYGIKIEMQDLRDFYKNRVLAQYFPVNAEDEESKKRVEMFIDSMMKNEEEVRRVYDMVFEEKLTAIFKDKVKVDKKSLSMEEFVEVLKKDNEKKQK